MMHFVRAALIVAVASAAAAGPMSKARDAVLGEAEVAAWLEASTLAPLMVDQVAAVPNLDQGPAPCVWHWQPKWDPD